MNRIGRVERSTKESTVAVEIDLDGAGKVDVSTGVPFYDHMLTAFGVHGAFDLSVQGDRRRRDRLAPHRRGRGDRARQGDPRRRSANEAGIRRFGDAWIPMDESLAHAAVDVSGRPYCVHVGEPEVMSRFMVGGNYATVLNRHVFESIAFHARTRRCTCGSSTAVTRTTSPRRSTRRSREHCAPRSRPTRG